MLMLMLLNISDAPPQRHTARVPGKVLSVHAVDASRMLTLVVA